MRLPLLAMSVLSVVGCSTAPGPSDGGSQCTVLGTWQGTYTCDALAGWPVSWQFNDDGGAVLSQGWPPATEVPQQWTVSAQVLTFSELSNPGCADAATYEVSLDGGCGTIGFARQSDSCAVRAQCINGLTLERP